MLPLSINDIKEWVIENRNEYQKLKSKTYPPIGNPIYSIYPQFYKLLEYFSLRHECESAIDSLIKILNEDLTQLPKWIKQYEIFGSEKLLMFELDYFGNADDIEDDFLKINTGLYTERKPFESILCFCKIFQILYWDNCLHKEKVAKKDLLLINNEVKKIIKTHYSEREK